MLQIYVALLHFNDFIDLPKRHLNMVPLRFCCCRLASGLVIFLCPFCMDCAGASISRCLRAMQFESKAPRSIEERCFWTEFGQQFVVERLEDVAGLCGFQVSVNKSVFSFLNAGDFATCRWTGHAFLFAGAVQLVILVVPHVVEVWNGLPKLC